MMGKSKEVDEWLMGSGESAVIPKYPTGYIPNFASVDEMLDGASAAAEAVAPRSSST